MTDFCLFQSVCDSVLFSNTDYMAYCFLASVSGFSLWQWHQSKTETSAINVLLLSWLWFLLY